jgi:hypothetical protein
MGCTRTQGGGMNYITYRSKTLKGWEVNFRMKRRKIGYEDEMLDLRILDYE